MLKTPFRIAAEYQELIDGGKIIRVKMNEIMTLAKAVISLTEEMDDHIHIAKLAKADADRNREILDAARIVIGQHAAGGSASATAWVKKYEPKQKGV